MFVACVVNGAERKQGDEREEIKERIDSLLLLFSSEENLP